MITYFTHTEPGGHAENEDRLEVVRLSHDLPAYLGVLADGQGGQAGGARAATVACRSCVERAASFSFDQLLSPLTWPTLLRHSDEAVTSDPEAGYSTLVGFCLTETTLCGASSGDSALLVRNAGKPPMILTAHQFKNPPVGCGAAVFVPFVLRLIAPWMVLAMTDGVWKYAGWETLFAAVANDNAEAILRSIHTRCVLPASGKLQDDFTLVIFQSVNRSRE